MTEQKRPGRWSRRAVLTSAVGLAGALMLTACSGSASGSSTTAAPTTQPAAKATTAPAAPAGSPQAASSSASAAASPASVAASPQVTASPAGTSASPQASAKVNANTASVADLQKAFEAAGISGAARWAREVDEYRPYTADDPTFGKLRRELAKYNPGPGVVDQIIATLAL